MTADAVRYVLESSVAQGAAWHVLRALVEQAEGCIASPSLEELRLATRYSTRNIIRGLDSLDEQKEIERLQAVTDKRRRVYHLKKMCDMKNASRRDAGAFLCPYLAEFLKTSKIGDWPKKEHKVMSPIPLLPEMFRAMAWAEEPLWAPIVTDEDLRLISNETRRKLGLPVVRETEFQLKP